MTLPLRSVVSWRAASVALVLLGAGFMLLRLGSFDAYRDSLRGDALLLIPATALVCLAVLGWGLCWALILTRLDHAASVTKCLRVFIYTWLGRYVPGTVPYHAGRVLAAESLHTTKTKVGATIAYETVLLLGSGAFLGCLGVLVGLGSSAGGFVYLITVVPLAALPVMLRPAVLVPIANRALCLAKRPPIDARSLLSGRETAAIFMAAAAVHLTNGLSFVLVLAALNHGEVNPFLAIGAYSIAGVSGTAAIFVPSGIGVREAVIVGLLSNAMAPEQAILAAGSARAVSVIADLLPLAGLGMLEAGNRTWRRLFSQPSPVPSTPESV